MAQITFSRKELYGLVWSEPMITIARKYNISDNGLRKICSRMDIPMPKAGHWQKLKFGKKIHQPSLSSNYRGDNEVTLSEQEESQKHPANTLSPTKALQKEIESNLNLYLHVPERLSNPDKLIIAARESINRTDRHERNGIISCYRGELDIRATKANIPRALRFMDTLIKLLRARGHSVFVDNHSTYVLVNSQKFEISLREKTKRVPRSDRPLTSDYLPTGILVLKIERIFHTKEWMDGVVALEGQLSLILAKLEISSAELNAQELIWKKKREEQEQKELLRKEYEKRREKEVVAFREMLHNSERWHKAVNLRNYIDAVERKAKENNSFSEQLLTWLEWARKKADWYDPFIGREDELLKNVSKDNLTIHPNQNHDQW